MKQFLNTFLIRILIEQKQAAKSRSFKKLEKLCFQYFLKLEFK